MTTSGAPATEPARCGATTDILVDHNVYTFCCDLAPDHSGDRHEGNVLLGDVPLRVAWPRDGEPSSRSSSAPMNAHGQLPSGLTLAALRERAVLFGGNGCEVWALDLLCLLDTLDELRGQIDESSVNAADDSLAPVVMARCPDCGFMNDPAERMNCLDCGRIVPSPYPTPDAYRAVCRALEKHRKRADDAVAALAARDAELAMLREQLAESRRRLAAARQLADMTEHRAQKRAVKTPAWTLTLRAALDGGL